ncbi:MAG TPA: alpha/beta fold hydrolase [Thermoanaerobaculia bacterium]|nr:alpha/beta fold hydrolase [Thermoanaerobaculia bacterium]
MKKTGRFVALTLLSGAGVYVAGSWIAGRALARRLISGTGLVPAREGRADLLDALSVAGVFFGELRYPGSRHDPVELSAVFASPDSETSARPTVLFLHGKGGNSAEWKPEAMRALQCGYNVLLPDLRSHGESEGTFMTYGFLETEDLDNAISAASGRFGFDPRRLGVHGCSAGATLAIELAAVREGVKALWIESPYADPQAMARHYLSLATGLPSWLLALTGRFAVRGAVAHVRRALDLAEGASGLESVDPLRSIARVRAPVCLVYGERDELVPPHFAARLELALPADAKVWRAANAGHCHHDDEPARVATEEYDRRWRDFFGRHLPVERESKV